MTATDHESFLLAEPGDELVADAPALAFEQLVQPAIAEATMLAGTSTKPLRLLVSAENGPGRPEDFY